MRIDDLPHSSTSSHLPVKGGPNRPGPLSIDTARRAVWLNGRVILLSPREFDMLQLLSTEPGRTFSRDEICRRIWRREHVYESRSVEIFIMRLRRKLQHTGPAPYIQTIRGIGYALNLVAQK